MAVAKGSGGTCESVVASGGGASTRQPLKSAIAEAPKTTISGSSGRTTNTRRTNRQPPARDYFWFSRQLVTHLNATFSNRRFRNPIKPTFADESRYRGEPERRGRARGGRPATWATVKSTIRSEIRRRVNPDVESAPHSYARASVQHPFRAGSVLGAQTPVLPEPTLVGAAYGLANNANTFITKNMLREARFPPYYASKHHDLLDFKADRPVVERISDKIIAVFVISLIIVNVTRAPREAVLPQVRHNSTAARRSCPPTKIAWFYLSES